MITRIDQFLDFMNELAGFSKFLEWVTSVVIFIIVYVIYRHLGYRQRWGVDYFPTRDGILLKIINRSGDEAINYIKLKEILYMNSDGRLYPVNAEFFPSLLDEMPTVMNDSHRVINIPIKNDDIDKALIEAFKKHPPKDKNGCISGKLIFCFTNGRDRKSVV